MRDQVAERELAQSWPARQELRVLRSPRTHPVGVLEDPACPPRRLLALPAKRRRQCDDAQSTAAVSELEGQPATERVPRDVCLLVPLSVQQTLELVHDRRDRVRGVLRNLGTAAVPGER